MSSEAQNQFADGVRLLNQGDFNSAIQAFSLLLNSLDLPRTIRAQALNHRGFAYLRFGNVAAAMNDWADVLKDESVPSDLRRIAGTAMGRVTSSSSLKLAEAKKASGDIGGAIAEYQHVLDAPFGSRFRPPPSSPWPTSDSRLASGPEATSRPNHSGDDAEHGQATRRSARQSK